MRGPGWSYPKGAAGGGHLTLPGLWLPPTPSPALPQFPSAQGPGDFGDLEGMH